MTSINDSTLKTLTVQRTCPIVEAIRDIRARYGGNQSDDGGLGHSMHRESLNDEFDAFGSSSRNIVTLGGVSDEFVNDETTYYMITRKLELARFKMTDPSLAACKHKYNVMFGDIAGVTQSVLYFRLVDKIISKTVLYTQMTNLRELLSAMTELIISKINRLGDQPINITLPGQLPEIDAIIAYRPDVLTRVCNNLITYVNEINVNSLLNNPLTVSVPLVDPFTGAKPVDTERVRGSLHIDSALDTSREVDDVAGYIKIMDHALEFELSIADYIHALERYHCVVINALNPAYHACQQIINGLTE